MSHVVEFTTDAGETVLVQVHDPPPPGPELASRGGTLVERAESSFEETMNRLRPVATTVVESLRSAAVPPDEIVVELGVKLSAKAGAIIASTDAEANLKVTLTWRRRGGANAA